MKQFFLSRFKIWLALIVMMASLSACVTHPTETVADFRLPKIELLIPATAQKNFSANQILKVTHDGQSHELEALLEWDLSSIHLAIVKFGKRIMTVNYDGVHVDVQKDAFVPEALQGEKILSYIQLVYWQTDLFKKTLPRDFSITDGDDVRTLSYKGRFVYRIVYHADHNLTVPRENSVHLSHLIYGYEMTVQSLPN